MMVPIGDAPNQRGIAFVTALLIAANVGVYFFVTVPLAELRPDPRDPALAEYVRTMARALPGEASIQDLLRQTTAYDLFVFRWGFRPSDPSFADLLSCMFLHGGFLHLAGNMLFLWIYGDNVERALGRVRYLLAYLGTGVAATLFHWLWSAGSPIPLVGASGAISGVLGLYFLWFPRNQVRLLWLLPPFVMQVFEVPARIVLGMYLVIDNLVPFFAAPAQGGVAHGAHIGGFLAGLAIAWLHDRRDLRAAPAEFAERGAAAPAAAAGEAIRAALDAGRVDAAARTYFALSPGASRRDVAPADARLLAEELRAGGHADAALAVARRALGGARGADAAALHLVAGLVLLEDLDEPALAFQHLRAALDVAPDADTEAAARRALRAVERLQKRAVGRLHRPHPW